MLGDLRYATRTLAKSPGFTAVAVLALALGIGASTTIFSAINALLLKPWPYLQDQHRIVYYSQYFTKHADQDAGVAYPDYLDFKREAKSFEGVAAAEEATFILSGKEKPDRYLGCFTSADTFSFFGVRPLLGRLFRPEEDDAKAAPVALLGYDVWQTRFGGRNTVIGEVVTMNGKRVTIVGVMPPGWRFPVRSDVWMPLQLNDKDFPRGNYNLMGFAKLKPGVSLKQGQAELQAISARLARDYPNTNTGCTARVKGLRDEMTKESRTLIVLLMGAVLFVHLIACANVANLLLARAATRRREIGIRLALGARRRDIVRQLLIEGVVLGLSGSLVGLVFSSWGVDLMLKGLPEDLPYFITFDFDWRMFAFALVLGLGSALTFGLFPALQASKPHLIESLKDGGRSGFGGGKGQRVRNGLVVAEVALALVLLVGAGLMLRSFLKTQAIDIGADPSRTLSFRVGMPPSQFDEKEVERFFAALMPRLEQIPGVESSGATMQLPAYGNIGMSAVVLEGESDPQELQNARLGRAISITPGYLKTCRISLLRGRDFTTADSKDAPRVALIDEEAARAWFPKADPIGRQVRTTGKPGEAPKWATIVGVVHNVIYDRLTDKRSVACLYLAQAQQPEWFMSVVLRTKNDPATYLNAARNAVFAVNKEIPIYRVFTMDEVVRQSFWERRFFGSLFLIFAALALFLAALGLYGVMAYSVRQRTQEIGVRIALGAQARDVMQLVAMQGMRLIVEGLVIGLIGAFLLTTLLRSGLEGVSPHDPASFSVVSIVLLLVGLLACYLPARAAMQLDPVEALRYE